MSMRGETTVPTAANNLTPGDTVMQQGERLTIERIEISDDQVRVEYANGASGQMSASMQIARVVLR